MLVDHFDWQPETRPQPASEAMNARGEGMGLRAIADRNPDDQPHGLPLRHQRRYRIHAARIVLEVDRLQRMRDRSREIAHGNADAFRAEIEGDYGPAFHVICI